MLKVLLVALVLSSLSACSTNNIQSDFKFSRSSGTGVVIGSIVLPGPEDGYTGIPQHATIHYRKVGTNDNNWLSVNEWDNPMYSGDFKDVVGKLFVLELPAGEYEIYSWDIKSGLAYLGQRIPLKFAVLPGAIKYLGEIKIKVQYGKNILGLQIGTSATITVNDSHKRDLLTVSENYPALSLTGVTSDLLKIPDALPDSTRVIELPTIFQPKISK